MHTGQLAALVLILLGAAVAVGQPPASQPANPYLAQARQVLAATDQGLSAAALLQSWATAVNPDHACLQAAYALAVNLALERGRLASSLPSRAALLEQAIEYARRLDRPADMAMAVAQVAEAQARAGQLSQARQHTNRGLELDLGPHRALLLVQLANLELTAGRPAQAVVLLADPSLADLKSARAERATVRMSWLQVNARAFLELGMADAAAPFIEDLGKAVGPQHEVVRLLWLDLALLSEDYETAIDLAQQLLDAQPPPSSVVRADLELRLMMAKARVAQIHQADGSDVLAALGQKIRATSQQMPRARLHLQRAAWGLEYGNVAIARESSRLAQDALASQAEIDVSRERAALAVVHARIALATPDTPETEWAKIAAELAAAHGQQLATWSKLAPRPGGVGFLYLVSRRNLMAAQVQVELHRHGNPEQALALLLTAQARGTMSRRLGLDSGTVALAQELLCPSDGGLLVYLPCEFSTEVFLVTRQSVQHMNLGSRSGIRPTIRKLKRQLSSAPPSESAVAVTHEAECRRTAALVGAALLPPALQDRVRGWHTLVVVGHEHLVGLPFEALPLEDGQPLGATRAISYLPSLPVGIALAQRSRPAAQAIDLWTLAATTPGPIPDRAALRELPATKETLHPWLAPYRKTALVLGNAATADLLRTGTRPDAFAWQILAHGCALAGGDQDERTATLVMAADATGQAQLLRCGEVERVPNPPPLVLLAACGASLGPERHGDDQGAHLASAFLYAGAVATVASRAEMHLDAALLFFTAVHQALARGAGIAEAARVGRQQLITGGFPALFHGANIQVHGLGGLAMSPAAASDRAAEGSTPTAALPWWTWPAAAALAAAAFLWHRRGSAAKRAA